MSISFQFIEKAALVAAFFISSVISPSWGAVPNKNALAKTQVKAQ